MPGVNGAGMNGGDNGNGNDGVSSFRRKKTGWDRDWDIPYVETVEEMDIKAQERMAAKNLELDRDKFEFLKTQAALPIRDYPSLSAGQYEAAPLITMPILAIAGLLFYFVKKKR